MVWESISARGMGNLHICEGSINAERCMQVLEWQILRPIQGRTWLFQQDETNQHSAQVTTAFIVCVAHCEAQKTTTETPECWATEVTYEETMKKNFTSRVVKRKGYVRQWKTCPYVNFFGMWCRHQVRNECIPYLQKTQQHLSAWIVNSLSLVNDIFFWNQGCKYVIVFIVATCAGMRSFSLSCFLITWFIIIFSLPLRMREKRVVREELFVAAII